MKITLDAIDGRNFTLRLPRDEGGEHVIALHDTRRLRGLYEHDDTRFSLDPVEADAIVCEVTWMLAAGSLHLGGPATFGATTLDIDLARGGRKPGVAGEARCTALAIPALQLTRTGMELRTALNVSSLDARHDLAADAWTLSAHALDLHTLSLALEGMSLSVARVDVRPFEARVGDGLDLAAAELHLHGVALALGATTLKAASAEITGLHATRDAVGGLTIEASEVTLTGVEVDAGSRRVRAPSLRLRALRYGADGTTFEHGAVDELSLWLDALSGDAAAEAPTPPDDVPAGTRRTLGIDLPFLDHLNARVEADVVVDVKLPVVKRRVATHRMRLDLRDGALDFKQLEAGLSRLEDAILDFEVVEKGLVLELDAVVMKRELVLWPLDADGLALARRRLVRLRTFARPTVITSAPQPQRSEADGEPLVALHQVAVKAIKVDGGLAGASTLSLNGGALRLGGDGTPALGSLRVSGTLVHDTVQRAPDTELAFDLANLELGFDALRIGARTLDVASLGLGRLVEGVVRFSGMSPASAKATLRDLRVRGFALRASA